jgi:hypothetical protein
VATLTEGIARIAAFGDAMASGRAR